MCDLPLAAILITGTLRLFRFTAIRMWLLRREAPAVAVAATPLSFEGPSANNFRNPPRRGSARPARPPCRTWIRALAGDHEGGLLRHRPGGLAAPREDGLLGLVAGEALSEPVTTMAARPGARGAAVALVGHAHPGRAPLVDDLRGASRRRTTR